MENRNVLDSICSLRSGCNVLWWYDFFFYHTWTIFILTKHECENDKNSKNVSEEEEEEDRDDMIISHIIYSKDW